MHQVEGQGDLYDVVPIAGVEELPTGQQELGEVAEVDLLALVLAHQVTELGVLPGAVTSPAPPSLLTWSSSPRATGPRRKPRGEGAPVMAALVMVLTQYLGVVVEELVVQQVMVMAKHTCSSSQPQTPARDGRLCPAPGGGNEA